MIFSTIMLTLSVLPWIELCVGLRYHSFNRAFPEESAWRAVIVFATFGASFVPLTSLISYWLIISRRVFKKYLKWPTSGLGLLLVLGMLCSSGPGLAFLAFLGGIGK